MASYEFIPLISIRLHPEPAIEKGIELLAEAFERFRLKGKGHLLARMLNPDGDEPAAIVGFDPAKFHSIGKDQGFTAHWQISFPIGSGPDDLSGSES